MSQGLLKFLFKACINKQIIAATQTNTIIEKYNSANTAINDRQFNVVSLILLNMCTSQFIITPHCTAVGQPVHARSTVCL